MVLIRRKTILEVVGIHRESVTDLLEVVLAVRRTGAFAGLIQCRQQQSGQDGDDRNHYKDNLSNILICSILAMTRRKAEGELSDESVDLCTSEQREG